MLSMLDSDIRLWKLNYPLYKTFLENIQVNVFLTSL